MSALYSTPLKAIIPAQLAFDGALTALDDIVAKIGLKQIDYSTALPPWASQSPGPPTSAITQAEALALLGFFDDGPEIPAPPDVDAPQTPIAVVDLEAPTHTVTMQLVAFSDVIIELPGLDGVSLVINPNEFEAILTLQADKISLGCTIELAIRFEPTLFQPAMQIVGADGSIDFVRDESKPWVEVGLGSTTIAIDQAGIISVTGGIGFHIADPILLGDTGIAIESADADFNFDGQGQRPAGVPQGWKGIYLQNANVRIPKIFSGTIVASGLGLGTGGISGDIGWTGSAAGQLFGMPFTLESLSLSFQQNIPTGSSIKGKITLPFFDHPVEVEIGLAADGGLTVGIDSTAGDGLAHLSIQDVLDLELDSLKFEVNAGVLTATISGKLTPTVPELTFPPIDIKDLKIDSKGHVSLPGGWLDLPKQYGLDFHGFKVDITKFGLGRNEDGTKWIGFSGDVKLVDGLPAGASVEGLRITADEHWTPSSVKVSFGGVGVELTVPGVLSFKGHVAHRPDFVDSHGNTVSRFDGDITLKLIALKLEIDGSLVVGSVKTPSGARYNFFAIYIGVELPTGIPFGTTGIAFYGFEGLLAIDMEPDKHADEPWYGIAPGEGWYKRGITPGVADLDKWRNELGSKAFGAGVTFGTYADNGYSINGNVLLAIVFPGPIILLEGKANLLKDRSKLNDEPLFRALAVLDNRAGTFLVGLDAQYQYDSTGKLVTISGGAEAFYKFNDPRAWHIYLGENEPRERRIQARLFSLLDANSYFMLDAQQLAMGAWIGYDKTFPPFGPLHVSLQAWAETNVIVSFKPTHFYGDLWLHGAVELKAFSVGLGLSVDARLAADVFKPFHILGDFSVAIDLPWPLKDISADVSIEWGPQPEKPPTSIALKEVSIEHFKASAKWPLLAPALLIPSWDDGHGFLTAPSPSVPLQPPADLPIVPLDCRPSLAFARNVHDDAQIGLIVQPPNPAMEWIGDPQKHEGPVQIRYALKQVQLDRWDETTSSWKTVAGKGGNISNLPPLFGTWAQVPGASSNSVAQNKLLLWSKTPYDHTRQTGSEWSDWFGATNKDYPCFADPPGSRQCLDFESLKADGSYASPMTHPDRTDVHFATAPVPGAGSNFRITALVNPVDGKHQALFTTGPGPLTIVFDNPVNGLHIAAVPFSPNSPINVSVVDKSGVQFGPFPLVNNMVDIAVSGIKQAIVVANTLRRIVGLVEVCADYSVSDADPALLAGIRIHNQVAAEAWSAVGDVLAPYTTYRLQVVTRIEVQGSPFDSVDEPEQFAFFRTGGPPGIAALISPPDPAHPQEADSGLSIPAGAGNPAEFDSGLGDLARYVKQTIPVTIPATGEKPLLPRPVYRGYDVGVQFNEDYVDLLYRMAGRDLSLMLYDRNNLPVRDDSGRLVVMANPWGVAENLSLSATEEQWLARLDGSGCVAASDHQSIPHDQTLSAAAEAQVLAPDALYNARLVPLLLHEDFGQLPAGAVAAGTTPKLGRWHIENPGSIDGPSVWKIEAFGTPPAHRLIQTSAIHAPAPSAGAALPGTMLVLDSTHPGLPITDPAYPANWTDFRASLYLRSSVATGMVGLAFRYQDPGTYYLFALDLQNAQCRLVSVSGAAAVIVQTAFTTSIDRDYHLAVEAIGKSLRVYIDDTLVFDVSDSAHSKGGLALVCGDNNGAAFSDVKVHDFGTAAKSVYQFGFTTSDFVNFFHHMHGFDDHAWGATCTLSNADVSSVDQNATADANSAISDDEGRAFERLADNVLAQSARQPALRTELTGIEYQHATSAFLFRTPEPIDWTRLRLELLQTNQLVPSPLVTNPVKLVAAVLGAQQPSDESITLLVRESIDLSEYRIEKRDFAGAISSDNSLPPVELDDPSSSWTAIFEFESETTVPDGTRIVVYSGNAANPPAIPPRTRQRFRANTGEAGDLQLVGDAVDLRLVAGDGSVVHARRFLKDGLYNPVHTRLLRKADGTAFFILPAGSGASFAQGSYRTVMDFKKDNTDAVADSIILSEAGETAPEFAVLDIPWPV